MYRRMATAGRRIIKCSNQSNSLKKDAIILSIPINNTPSKEQYDSTFLYCSSTAFCRITTVLCYGKVFAQQRKFLTPLYVCKSSPHKNCTLRTIRTYFTSSKTHIGFLL